MMIDEDVLREVENRLWICIRDNFNSAYDLEKYLGMRDYIDREYNEYLVHVKFLTEEDLSDTVKITKNFAKFYRAGCPGFLSIDIFQD